MKHLKKFENFSYNSEEIIDEGVLDIAKKLGRGISRGAEKAGIYKSMTTRMDNIFGFKGEEFSPTSRLKIYINQCFDLDQISTNDIETVGEALRKARVVGYGASGWSDEIDLSKMEGTEEEKNIAKCLINRALTSIHSTAPAQHEFGGRAELSALESVKNRRGRNRKV